ncbi:hypothetical protein EBU94_01085 [bacterium]|nr:hypothetical protein [bacterium]
MQTLTEIIYDLYAEGHTPEGITQTLMQDSEIAEIGPVTVHTIVTETLTYLHQEWEADFAEPVDYYNWC